MKVHHLDCLTMCPLAGRLFNRRGRFCCHVLVVESEQGLVLVDTALGVEAMSALAAWTSATFVRLVRPQADPAKTALRQLEARGFSARDVRHILLTHLDTDHAGGIADFPAAEVHVLADEHAVASSRTTMRDRERYNPRHWAHGPTWRLHRPRGERWYGFEAVRDVPGLPPEVLLVPLPGHSRGQCGVAVDVGNRWLLHCGDAFMHHEELLGPSAGPLALRLFQQAEADDRALREANLTRLRDLAASVGEGMAIFCAHDPEQLERLQARPEAG
ncbi:MAG: MBL fold metallo-hydrolase [Deltaproteobacteria bacterium]|nr:MBL fold metallo-hydrolase [Deltaproteobacteria bacterium]